MSSVKSRLKTSRDAIQAKNWEKGAEEAQQVLNLEADNYNALVFRGLALLHLQRYDESEDSYKTATKVQPTQQLAWQGLEKFYAERKLWDKQASVLRELMGMTSEADDATKCAEALQRLVALQRAEGSRSQIADALSCYLPTSAYHEVLSRLPRPDQTNPEASTTFESEMAIHIQSLPIIEEVIRLTQEAEDIAIEKEIEKKRTRLDSAKKSKEMIKFETSVDVWRLSKLPELYELILAHVDASDEQRREAEHKLLAFRYHLLQALPNPKAKIAGPGNTAAKQDRAEEDNEQSREKAKALQEVVDQAAGIVTIDVPDELAWNITLEWHSVFSPAELKLHHMRAYIDHFPRSGLSHSFKALLYALGDEQFVKEEKERFEQRDVDVSRTEGDILSLAIVGLQESSQSILAHRIAAGLYLQERDWLSCSDVATVGLSLAREAESTFSVDLCKIKAGLESSLGTALTHLFPPQHHARALRLADAVLLKEEGNIEAMLCKAHISQTAGHWEQARALFADVQSRSERLASSEKFPLLQKLSLSKNPAREARLEVAWCDVNLGRFEQGKEALRAVVGELDATDPSGEDQAKAWWRLGSCLWQMGGTYQEEITESFTCFITALKRNPSYAPAFTSLGFYYKEVSNPPDLVRAAKCFQKAFELDATENVAAFELAKSYADDDDWDLVFLVAQRAIEGEGGGEALSGEIKSQRRHITRNAWAWTAIGSTELLRQKYEKAITALQIALRSFPHDGQIWMKLGEAYTASGRLTAGVKAFEKSLEILEDTKYSWQPKYNISQIFRQQGLHSESMEILLDLNEQEPDLLRIHVACAEGKLLLGLDQIRQAYTEVGSSNVYAALVMAQEVIKKDSALFAAWKVLADGLSHCACLQLEGEKRQSMHDCLRRILELMEQYKVDASLPSISAVTRAMIDTDESGQHSFLLSSIYLHKFRVLLHYNDEQVAGSVWMDLGVNLHRLSAAATLRERHDERWKIKSQAIACVKEALKMEPGNGVYWSALGSLVFHTSVKLAQHCYSKAIECDASNASTWTSLGFLYLHNDDVPLAKECFIKAQTLEPDCVEVWIGHALLAKKQGRQGTYKKLYQHAYEIDEANSSLQAGYGFASSLLRSGTSLITRSELSSASFALSSYLAQRPDDVSALHLYALFAERLNELDSAIEHIQKASSILEVQYEEDESTEKARLFAVCMVNLGRIMLKRGDEESAKESFEMALGLLTAGEEEEEEKEGEEADRRHLFSQEDLRKARLCAHCGNGIAQFAMGQEQDAMAELSQTLEEGGDIEEGDEESREQLCLLLARMLWIDENQQEAESYVMEALSARPKSVDALLALGSIACVNKDEEQRTLVEAELEQLLSQSPPDNNSRSSSGFASITSFLASMKLQQGQVKEAVHTLKRPSSDSSSSTMMMTTSLASQVALTRLLLTLALQSPFSPSSPAAITPRPDNREEEQHQVGDSYPQQALAEALRLLEIAENNSVLHDGLLVDTLRLASIACTLVGRKAEAVDMATRCAALQPGNLAHWSLLQTIHRFTAYRAVHNHT